MLDINFIRENAKKINKAAKDKGIQLDVEKLLKLDDNRREIIGKIDTLRSERKRISSVVGSGFNPEPENSRTKGSRYNLEPTRKGSRYNLEPTRRYNLEPTRTKLINQAKKINVALDKLDKEYAIVKTIYDRLMAQVPTIPSPDTPIGTSDKQNKEVYRKGKIPKFNFTPKDHIQIGKDLDILDLERGVKIGGYRGYYVKREGALILMGLMMHALTKLVKKGFQPMIPPTLVKGFALFGSGYFKGLDYNPEVDEIYQLATPDKESTGSVSKEKKFLVGTAEPSLLAYFADEVLQEKDLPIKVCGFSQCYRSEIGSYGKDTKGMYRVHEFMKVEQVILTRANVAESVKLQNEMLKISEELHQDLGIPYRKLQICTGDMGVGKYRMFDLEAWMPGLNRWGETGSASDFLDWQSRRLNVKYINKKGEKEFVYMLNNTALATPRTFIAILENYQQKDGSVLVPKVLQKYVGKKVIRPKK